MKKIIILIGILIVSLNCMAEDLTLTITLPKSSVVKLEELTSVDTFYETPVVVVYPLQGQDLEEKFLSFLQQTLSKAYLVYKGFRIDEEKAIEAQTAKKELTGISIEAQTAKKELTGIEIK